MARTTGLAALLAAALTVAGCGAGASDSARTAGSAAVAGSRTAAPPSHFPFVTAPAFTPPAPSAPASTSSAGTAAAVPRFDHIVVVVLENHAYSQLVGQSTAPYLNSLAERGAVLTRSYALTHPSEPNYLALFSGSTQNLTDDSCPQSYAGPNLAAALLAGGHSFAGYSEDLPEVGFTGCSFGAYARKHNPWVDFAALPKTVNQPLTALPSEWGRLPEVSFVIPDLNDDMHDGTVAEGDRWLRAHLGGYVDWSTAHNSLLVLTADEDDKSHDNRIATLLIGAHVRPGRYSERIDHYGLLATLLAAFGLSPFGGAARVQPITTVWSN